MKNQIQTITPAKWFMVLIFSILPLVYIAAQNSGSYTTSIEMTTLKSGEGSRSFSVTLTASGDSGEFPVYQGEVQFYSSNGPDKILIGKSLTNENGVTVFVAQPGQKYLKDKSGVMNLSAVFAETPAMSASEASVKLRDLNLKMELIEQDSTKSIMLTVNETDANGEQVPVKEADVVFYVAGMFSKLKIGDATVDNGTCSFDFPSDLRGDEHGNLRIFARIEDNADFGTIEATETAQWGQHRSNYTDNTRQLWTKGAPVWMIVTLTILLIGVWSHYIYAIIQLFFIKKEGDKIVKSGS